MSKPSRRILFLITDLKVGGTPTVVRELAIRLREPGPVETAVACLAPWGPVADQLRDAGVPVTALDAASPAAFPRTLVRLARLIRGGRFDTVFSFLVHANAVAAAASVVCPGVRFLQSIQTTQPNPRWHWRVQRLIAAAADRVVVPSPSTAAVARRWAGVPRAKLVVIPNAVDVASFDAVYAARRPPDPDRFVVGFVGRLDPVKRVPNLIRAMPLLPGATLHVYGEGPDRPAIESEIARLNLVDRVTLHGQVSRPHEALAAVDALVLPSAAEGFGLVLIEAMAAGVPVAAADVAGINDVVRPGETGVLFPARAGPADVAGAIARLADPAWRATVVAAGRRDVARRFGWDAVLAAYRRLLGIGSGGG